MTLTASQANQLTQDAVLRNMQQDVLTEVQRAEQQIRQRVRAEHLTLAFDAVIIGNPTNDPSVDENLSPSQIDFRDHFVADAYIVGLDPRTGFWSLDWAVVGAEVVTSLYSVRTTVTPGAIEQQTIDVINNYFNTLPIRATSRTNLADTTPSSGGDIPESDFGAPDSTFYEYVALVEQQDDTNHSASLKAALRASGLGYVDDNRITGVGTSSNTTSPTNTLDISDGTTTATVTVGGTGTAANFVSAVNANPTLQAIKISADINGPDVLIVNELGGTLIATDNVGSVLTDLFALSSPQTGVVTDNTEVYKLA